MKNIMYILILVETTMFRICALIVNLVLCSDANWQVSTGIENEGPITGINIDYDENLHFSAMGKNFDLKLKPADNIFAPNFKIFSVRSLDNGETAFEDSPQDKQDLPGSFHSIDGSYGSIYIDQTGDNLKLDGILDDETRIITSEPDSYRVIKLGWKRKGDNPYFSDEVVLNSTNIHDVVRQKDQGEKSDEVTIEVLILMDEPTVEVLERDNRKISQYVGVYWNSVQRRFADFENPRIKFSLTGISKLDRNELKSSTIKPDLIDGHKLHDVLSHFLYKHKKDLPKFDIAMFQTKLDLCSPSPETGECHKDLLGRAFVGGVCHENSEEKKSYSCGIGHDDVPLYSGIITTAHEVAHILGAPHDGSDKAVNCPSSDGYIMGHDHKGSHSWHFSTCSKEIISNHVQHNADCVKDAPLVKISIPKTLPGEMTSPDQICTAMYGKGYSLYRNRGDICNEMHCIRNRHISYFGPAPEGTTCGKNKYCVDGNCIRNITSQKRIKTNR